MLGENRDVPDVVDLVVAFLYLRPACVVPRERFQRELIDSPRFRIPVPMTHKPTVAVQKFSVSRSIVVEERLKLNLTCRRFFFLIFTHDTFRVIFL